MKKRKDSFFGIHLDFHGKPEYGVQGATLKEEDIRQICRTLQPDFIQIDCKGHPGWASYPSKIGNALPEFSQDTLALWRRVTRDEGVALYMHYSGVYDIKYCAEHPEHTAVDAEGNPHRGATRLDCSYVDDLMIPQILELAGDYGVDGMWVDGDCWMANADFSPASLAAFEKETGIDLAGQKPAKRGDPYFDEYREYQRELYRRFVRHYVDAVHEKYPDFQIASNWAFSDHMPEQVCANVDFLSGDLDPNKSFVSARYAARALAQQEGYAWDLMSWNFRTAVGKQAAVVTKHPKQIMQEAAAVIAMGGAYQNYLTQFKDGSPDVVALRNLKPLAEFVRERQPFCFRGTPIRQVALLLSTYDRGKESFRLYSRNGYEKIMGLSTLLCDVGQSLEIVGEHTLAKHRDEYKMIVIPELYHGLEPETVQSLLQYAKNGGKLVLVGKNTCKIFAEAGAPFAVKQWEEFFKAGEKAYDNGGENGHAKNGQERQKSYFFTMDGNYFGAMFAPCEIVAEDGEQIAYLCEDQRSARAPLAATIPFGKGCVAAIGFDMGTQYLTGTQYLHRDLMKQIADNLYVPMVRIESVCGRPEIVALCKDGKIMIQLVNAGGNHADISLATDDYIPPVLDLELSIELPEKPAKLILQPEGRELPFAYRDGRAYVSIPRVDIHSIIEVAE